MYEGNVSDARTFGVGATLVTSGKVPNEVVYALTKSVFDNVKRSKRRHPALGILKQSELIKDGLLAPIHDAQRIFVRKRNAPRDSGQLSRGAVAAGSIPPTPPWSQGFD